MKESYDRACELASEHQLVVFPKASGEACLTIAYSVLKCQEAFSRQAWHTSFLKSLQAKFTPKYDLTDFATWVDQGCRQLWQLLLVIESVFFQGAIFHPFGKILL